MPLSCFVGSHFIPVVSCPIPERSVLVILCLSTSSPSPSLATTPLPSITNSPHSPLYASTSHGTFPLYLICFSLTHFRILATLPVTASTPCTPHFASQSSPSSSSTMQRCVVDLTNDHPVLISRCPLTPTPALNTKALLDFCALTSSDETTESPDACCRDDVTINDTGVVTMALPVSSTTQRLIQPGLSLHNSLSSSQPRCPSTLLLTAVLPSSLLISPTDTNNSPNPGVLPALFHTVSIEGAPRSLTAQDTAG